MKKEYFSLGKILSKYTLKMCPKGTGEVIGKIRYLLKRYLQSEELQYLISDYQFFKYHDCLEEELKDIIPLYKVKIMYPYVLIKSVLNDTYVKAIIIYHSYRAMGLDQYFRWLDENRNED